VNLHEDRAGGSHSIRSRRDRSGGGCAGIVHAGVLDPSAVYGQGRCDSHLLGTWFEPPSSDDHSVITFERLNTDAYTVSITDPTKQPSPVETYEAHLVQLNGRLFIDVVQSDIKVGDDNALVLAVAGHMFGRISLGEDGLKMSFLDDEWIEKALQSEIISVPHETSDDGRPVLTATTAELQRIVLSSVDDDKAFSIEVGPLEHRK
jgi:hypothetical protein